MDGTIERSISRNGSPKIAVSVPRQGECQGGPRYFRVWDVGPVNDCCETRHRSEVARRDDLGFVRGANTSGSEDLASLFYNGETDPDLPWSRKVLACKGLEGAPLTRKGLEGGVGEITGAATDCEKSAEP
jgi:hypothetical protein